VSYKQLPCSADDYTVLIIQMIASFSLSNTAAFKSSRHSESLKTFSCSDSLISAEDTNAILILPSLWSRFSPASRRAQRPLSN
jgi:hypothetical protein